MTTKSYLSVFLTFARNSLVRDMTYRANFIIECISSFAWMAMNLGFYALVFSYTAELGQGTGWQKYQFFAFLATGYIINSVVQAFFMPNAEEFSELIRTGGLDFALLKPIDTQFLVSLHKVDWSSIVNFAFGWLLLAYALFKLGFVPALPSLALYGIYVIAGITILYSLMTSLAATSIWLGQNQNLYDFWFYITNFARYPMEIYDGPWGLPLRHAFTFIIPILIVVNIPARLMIRPLVEQDWKLAGFALAAAVGSLVASRLLFQRALFSYRSASS